MPLETKSPRPAAEQRLQVAPHLRYLDGLRGLASLFVVAHHVWLASYGMQPVVTFPGALVNGLLYGHLAVDVFIVLSGFCLVLPHTRSPDAMHVQARSFYARRIRRIAPPFYAMLLISIVLVVLARILFGRRPGMPFTMEGILANLFFLQDVFPTLNTFNPPFWSVAVEAKIYFLFPLFVYIRRRFGIAIMLCLACAIGFGLTLLILLFAPGAELGHSCPWYVALFGMGMSAAFLLTRIKQSTIGDGAIALGTALLGVISIALLVAYPITESGEYEFFVPHLPYIDVAVGACTASFLLWIAVRSRAGKPDASIAVLSSRPLVFVGTFAYSLYLVHYPLVMYANVFIRRVLKSNDPTVIAVSLVLVGLPLILLAAYLFFLAFERPFLSSATRRPSAEPKTTAAST